MEHYDTILPDPAKPTTLVSRLWLPTRVDFWLHLAVEIAQDQGKDGLKDGVSTTVSKK